MVHRVIKAFVIYSHYSKKDEKEVKLFEKEKMQSY